jgi:murein DD-endopeptidase MepM/ murein hydrolase activator NlpD/methionine-rich copper-binding protein CopC
MQSPTLGQLTSFVGTIEMSYIARILTILLSIFASLDAHADRYVTIIQPTAGQRLNALPVDVSFSFTHPVQTGTVSVALNGRMVTNKFQITSDGGTASLGIEDGIKPSLGSNGNYSAPNSVVVKAKTAAGINIQDSILFYVKAPIDPLTTTGTITSDGGTLQLPNYGSVSFQAGSFSNPQIAKLAITATADTADDWDTTSELFSPISRLSYEIRVNTGATRTAKDIQVQLTVPSDYTASLPSNGEVKLFAAVMENGPDDEVLYSFELFDATFDGTAITASLPSDIFTNLLTVDASYELTIVIAALPTKSLASPRSLNGNRRPRKNSTHEYQRTDGKTALLTPSDNETACYGSSLGYPLAPPVTLVTGGEFHPTAPRHYGIDYRAADGTNVLAMADGVVENVAYQVKNLLQPDPRSGKMIRGWGTYVVLRHIDGSATLYAHLQNDSYLAIIGAHVSRGDVIAHSDSSGGISGPHLHVEYAQDGKMYQNSHKTDPAPCIGLASGEITIGDNGNIADDSFAVYVDGALICISPEGGTEKCQISGIKSGAHALSFTCLVAPDDLGTWFIQLNDGLTFSDGGTYATGVVPEGGGSSFTILVP